MSRSRPPRLEPAARPLTSAEPATIEELLVRAKVAGPVSGPGASEIRRIVERIVRGDRQGYGAIPVVDGMPAAEAWTRIHEVFGSNPDEPCIDPARTLAGAAAAGRRIREVAATGGRIALATSAPASLLGLHLAAAAVATEGAGTVVDLNDVGPIRADGRSPRWIRWINGVATVTDGSSMCASRDAEPAREWLFVVGRPALVVADGPFAEVAWAAGLEVVAFAGLADTALAVASGRTRRCTMVPMRCDRPSRAYTRVITCIEQGESPSASTEV